MLVDDADDGNHGYVSHKLKGSASVCQPPKQTHHMLRWRHKMISLHFFHFPARVFIFPSSSFHIFLHSLLYFPGPIFIFSCTTFHNFMILLFLFSLYFWIDALFHIASTFDPLRSFSRTARIFHNRKSHGFSQYQFTCVWSPSRLTRIHLP